MVRKKTRAIDYEEVDRKGRAEIRSVRQNTSIYRGKKTLEFNNDDTKRNEPLIIQNNSKVSYSS